MENNIISVSSKDATSITKGLDEVKKLFSNSIQSVVFTKQIYADKTKEAIDKFAALGCPFARVNNPDDIDSKFEEIKTKYANIVLVE